MPELPEVETMRRGVMSIKDSTVVRAERTPCPKRPIAISPRIDHLNKRIAGSRIVSVDRLGKRVVIRFSTDDRLIFEPRMTGLVLITEPPTMEHLRFRLVLRKNPIKELLFWDRRGLGKVTLLSDKQYQAKLNDGSLGPDALAISESDFPCRFNQSKRPIKVALLDQAAVAGVGNLYASEILHLAGVHPEAQCNRLSGKQWSRIYKHMREVLEMAIRYEGSTLSDGTYRNVLNQDGSFQNEHRVYDRAGDLCPSCGGGKILRIVQAQRSTFYCKKCQKKR
jgi:formamidopyrimidine-DNA glycosylase